MTKILNLGCGDESYGTHRVDIHPTKTTTHVFDVENGLPFPDNFFDEVYERNLLEHIRDLGFHLAEVYRVLKKGGKLILITDNAVCIRFYVRGMGVHRGGYKGHRRFLNPNTSDKHYAIFTEDHLCNLLTHANFVIKKIRHIDTDFVPSLLLDRFFRLFPFLSPFTYPRIEVVAFK